MSRDVRIANAAETLQEAAEVMADEGVGALPVGDEGRLVGLITERDIVCRAVALGRAPADTPVREVMSEEVLYCFEDEDVDETARHMDELKIRRMPVLDRRKRLVGVVALADIRQRASRDDVRKPW
jgi:CBS domain-containing protein